jgi:hypothetical protein
MVLHPEFLCAIVFHRVSYFSTDVFNGAMPPRYSIHLFRNHSDAPRELHCVSSLVLARSARLGLALGGTMLREKPVFAPRVRDSTGLRINAITTPNACAGGDECH